MAPDIAINELPMIGNDGPLAVLDPMCGSGTVLAAASAKGHKAIGFDVDPLAVLMSEVATMPVDTDALDAVVKRVVSAAARSRIRRMPWDDEETEKFSLYWFGDKQRLELARVSAEINEVKNLKLRKILQIALSRTIITKSPRASLAGDTSHSRPHRVVTSSDYDVIAGFEQSATDLTKYLSKRSLSGDVKVELGDSRRLTSVKSGSIDLTITSPPYLNAIDYLRGHKMSLIWFGYSIPDLRVIRSGSIGAERKLTVRTESRVQHMVDLVITQSNNESALPIGTITRYAHDLCAFADQLFRVSKEGARAVIVIGNSALKGNYIQNDMMVSRAVSESGFTAVERVERDLPENQRYLPINTRDKNSSMSKRMRTEVVLTLKK